MERGEAARLLGVDPGSSTRQVERAFRTRAKATHPDRFPPGSEAWEDASVALTRLLEARDVLTASGPPAPGTRVPAPGSGWAWAEDVPRPTVREEPWAMTPRDVDRMTRRWGLWWGGFLVVAALVSVVVGARDEGNLALPLWSPALALTGLVALAIGLRAHRRITRDH